MKICFLAGASSIHTIRWVNAMADRGHRIYLITMHPSEQDRIDSRVTVYNLKVPAPFGYYVNILETKTLLQRIKPDLLHVHYASGYGTLARFVNYSPSLLSVWGSDVFLFPYQNKKSERILRKNLDRASAITATGYALKEQTEHFIHSGKPISVVPFGIDLNLFDSVPKRTDNSFVIGTVKRMKHIYGIDLLMKATAQLIEYLRKNNQLKTADQIKLMIVGDGPQLTELQQLSVKLNIADRTEFVGAVMNEQVPEYINQLDVYCAFSRSESFGVAVLEASACKVPVMVSNIGGLPEVVQDGHTGYVVELNDVDSMVEKLYELVSDGGKRRRFGENGRKFVQEHYEWKQNVDEMEQIYLKLV